MRGDSHYKMNRVVLVSSANNESATAYSIIPCIPSNLFVMRFSITAAVLGLLFYAGTAMAQDVGEPCPADQAGMYNIVYVLFSASQFGGVNRRYWLREHSEC